MVGIHVLNQYVSAHNSPAIVVDEQTRPSCTPAAVCAPELMFERVVRSVDPPPTRASDIWSLACTVSGLGLEISTCAAANVARMLRFMSWSSQQGCFTLRPRMTPSWALWRRCAVRCRSSGKTIGIPESGYAICVSTCIVFYCCGLLSSCE